MSNVKRTFNVLSLLAARAPLGVRAIAQQLKLPLGSTHRILVDLEAESVAERTPAGEWELSFRLLEIAGLQIERIQIPQIARPMLEKLAEATGETVHLSAPSGTEAVCLDKAQTNFQLQLSTHIGSHGPMFCTGSGKALLAFLPPGERERALEAQTLRAVTPHTFATPVALRRELQRTRERGYSLDHEEAVLGVHCVGVPIFNRFGRAVAAISVSGASPKSAGPDLDWLVRALKEAASYVSRRLGYAGEPTDSPRPRAEGKAAPARQSRVKRGDVMMRAAWIMRLKPGCQALYKEKHDNIWPEMLALMRRQGVRNFSIYREGLTLFAYQERESPADPAAPHDPVVWRWWKMMAPLMETNPDGSPWQQPIEEVFHAD